METINNAKLKRNFLFCLLSNIETDLRKSILEINDLKINDDIKKRFLDRYDADKNNITDELELLINYADLGDYIQILNSNSEKFLDAHLLGKLTKDIESIIPTRNRIMHIRPLEYNDDEKLVKFVSKLNMYCNLVDFSETISEYNKIKENPDYLLSIIPNVLIKEKQNVKHNLPMVDYDDTGFIGRNKDKEELKKKINGPYPVISVIGVGGIGKTSLVLSCLYDLLDEDLDFRTVIWITLKTKGLYNGDFQNIKSAILNLDENFKFANKEFNDIKISNVHDVLEYMEDNKTLLVIDNLETLSNDKSITKLFEEIPNGSKILITSRIGVGNYEQSFHLSSLTDNEALVYFRKLVNIYKVNSLIKKSDIFIKKYLKQLDNNPLAIKWFVINVGRGMEPSDIFNNHIGDLTDFCLSNIYDKLSDNAKYILRIILIKLNKCGMAELLYLCELSYDQCLAAINELFKSNFLMQNEDFSYSILDFAVNYIQNRKGFSNYEMDNKIQVNINKLNGNLENLKKDIHLTNKYHPLSLFPKTDNERIATLYMLKAIEVSKSKNYSAVDEFFELAKNADGSFADLYKIAGYLYSKYDSIRSEENYRIALDLAENKAPIYYFFAGSLINNQKYEMAEIEINKALKIEPDNCLIKLRYARLKKMQNKYEESLELLSQLDISNFVSDNRMESKYIFEMIDTRIRYAEMITKSDNVKALNLIKETIYFLNKIDSNFYDFTIYNSIFKLSHVYIRLLFITNFDISEFLQFLFKYYPYILAAKNGNKKELLFESDLAKLCQKLSEDDSKKINDIINYKVSIKELNYGYISSLKKGGYGFITPFSYSYQTIFFHCSHFKGDFRKLNISDKVSFELLIDKKIVATNVQLCEFNDNIDKDFSSKLN